MNTMNENEALCETMRCHMRFKLTINNHKIGWSDLSNKWIFHRIHTEIRELAKAIDENKSSTEIWREAADAANFLAMLSDNYEKKHNNTATHRADDLHDDDLD